MNRRNSITSIFGIVDARLCDKIVAVCCRDNRLIMIAEHTDSTQHILYSDDCGHTLHTADGPPCEAGMNDIYAMTSQCWFICCLNCELWETRDMGKSWLPAEHIVIDTRWRSFNCFQCNEINCGI